VQDFEFTIQDGKLFMLQTRNGKRTGVAAVRFAVEMEKESSSTGKPRSCASRPTSSTRCSRPIFDLAAIKKAKAIATGLPAGPGAASGKVYFNADRAPRPPPRARKSSSSAMKPRPKICAA
jgi:pyruvate,orthophosphate dikinase